MARISPEAREHNFMSRLKNLFALTLLVGILMEPALAIKNHNLIQWRAPTKEFVVSLYKGVFGKAPSAAIAGELASQVSSDPKSRLALFKKMVNSKEHQQQFGSNKGVWTVYRDAKGTPKVAKSQPAGFQATDVKGVSYQYAACIAGFYKR